MIFKTMLTAFVTKIIKNKSSILLEETMKKKMHKQDCLIWMKTSEVIATFVMTILKIFTPQHEEKCADVLVPSDVFKSIIIATND